MGSAQVQFPEQDVFSEEERKEIRRKLDELDFVDVERATFGDDKAIRLRKR